MTPKKLFILWPLLVLLATPILGAESAQDTEISVSPVIHHFPVTAFGSDSAAASFSIHNHRSSSTLSLGTLSLSELDADQFALGTDGCSGVILPADGTCSIEVIYRPTKRGTVSTTLRIPSDASATPTLTAFVSNHEVNLNEAQRRMPPVLASVAIEETMQADQQYTLSWALEGYHDSYGALVALFDCSGISDGSCGDSYGDASRFAASAVIEPSSITPGNWTYSGVATQQFNYTWDFTVPATRADDSPWDPAPGTDIVVRFYLRNNIDAARGKPGVSLLIPGNQSASYYDTEGRRILKKIIP